MTLVNFHTSQQSVTQGFVGQMELCWPDPKMGKKRAQDSSSLAEGCFPISLLSSSLSTHTWIQQCGKLRWAAATELLFKTAAWHTWGDPSYWHSRICTLAHCFPQSQTGRTSSTHSMFEFMRQWCSGNKAVHFKYVVMRERERNK